MGFLLDGIWRNDSFSVGSDGAFKRPDSVFRNWITADGSAGPSGTGGFKAESGRYHLYVSYACPWAHRGLIYRQLKGLADHITYDSVHPDMLHDGWTFATDFPGATGDRLFGSEYLRDIYIRADPKVSGRSTVPILWDKKTGQIVSNESAEIIRMLDHAFDSVTGPTDRLLTDENREEVDAINARVYPGLNNGVYRSGFARSQSAYDEAVGDVFDTLDWLEAHLTGRRFLTGDTLSEADIRLVTTLFRFDPVYVGHFKCNRARLIDYPELWDFTRTIYQMPGIANTCRFDHIIRHYHYSHESINPHRIIPTGQKLDWSVPTRRG